MKTKREYLVGLGLAEKGKGRFSKDAQTAIDAAISQGMVFADAPTTRPQPTGGASATRDYDAKAVRKWAAVNGISVGVRGRISADIVNRFYDEQGDTMTATVEAAVPAAPAAEPVREETVAFGLARRAEDDPDYISEPVVGFTNCGRCGESIQKCPCASGPYVPTYLTNGQEETASLTIPAE